MAKAEARADTKVGVDVKKVDREHLFGVLKELGVEVTKKTPSVLVSALETYYEANPPTEMSNPCDNCQGVSDLTLAACPFCGLDDSGVKVSKTTEAFPKTESGIVVAAKAEIVKDDLVLASKVQTTRELDEAVAEVGRLRGDAAVSYWHLGAKVQEIQTRELWKLRLDDKGKPRYKGFDAFTHAELQMTPQGAYALIDCAQHYSEDQARALGKTRAVLLLKVAESDRKELLGEVIATEQAGGKVSARELAAKVGKVKKETGYVRPTHSAKGTGGQSKKHPEKKREEKVTVASLLGRVKVKMWKKPEGSKWTADELVRVKRLADVPFAFEELENGVVAHYFVQQNAEGELDLVIVRKRAEEKE